MYIYAHNYAASSVKRNFIMGLSVPIKLSFLSIDQSASLCH